MAPSTDWTYHVVQGTVYGWQPAQPRAIGFAGYDTSGTGIMELDGIEILSIEEQSTGFTAVDPAKVLGYYDAVHDAIVISKLRDDDGVVYRIIVAEHFGRVHGSEAGALFLDGEDLDAVEFHDPSAAGVVSREADGTWLGRLPPINGSLHHMIGPVG